jgi:molybdopterin-guanine dinucleotide biosynthesis protein A
MSDNLKQKSIIGVVLAGGQSLRMGQDKALLAFQGATLLHHQVRLLQSVCEHVVVSGEYMGFDCIPDLTERCGPLSGLYSVTKQFPDSALLILPVDMPQVTEAHLRALIKTQLTCHIQGHPMPAYFSNGEQLLEAIAKMLDGTNMDFSIWHLHRLLDSHTLYVNEFNGLNINNPEQWQIFCSEYESKNTD